MKTIFNLYCGKIDAYSDADKENMDENVVIFFFRKQVLLGHFLLNVTVVSKWSCCIKVSSIQMS